MIPAPGPFLKLHSLTVSLLQSQGGKGISSNEELIRRRATCCQICRLGFCSELAALQHLSSDLHLAFRSGLKNDLTSKSHLQAALPFH